MNKPEILDNYTDPAFKKHVIVFKSNGRRQQVMAPTVQQARALVDRIHADADWQRVRRVK